MNTAIYKYELNGVGLTELQLPAGAKILSIGYQGAILMLWAEVNPENKVRAKIFKACLTGPDQVPTMPCTHLATKSRTGFVVHVYQVNESVGCNTSSDCTTLSVNYT